MALEYFTKSNLDSSVLAKIWYGNLNRINTYLSLLHRNLAELDKDGKLNEEEFYIAMHLINCYKQTKNLPDKLPLQLNYLISPNDDSDFEVCKIYMWIE